jgi:hypothetical protein
VYIGTVLCDAVNQALLQQVCLKVGIACQHLVESFTSNLIFFETVYGEAEKHICSPTFTLFQLWFNMAEGKKEFEAKFVVGINCQISRKSKKIFI